MAHTNPFPLNIYWSSTVELVDGVVGVNNSFADETVCIDAKYSFDEFYDMVCGECGFNRAVVRLKFTLVWTEADGCRRYILLKNDRNMMFLYMYAANKPELYVSVEKISNVVDGTICEPAVAGETIGSGNERIDMEYTEQANEEAEMPISILLTCENEEIGDLPEDEEMSAWTGSSSDEEFVPSDDSYDGEDDVPSTSGHFVYGDIGEDNGEEEIAEGLNM